MGGTGGVVGHGRLIRVGSVVYGADAMVAEWIATQIPGFYRSPETKALGVIKGGELVAGVAYESHTGLNVMVSIAARPKRAWADRRTLFALFDYPFNQLGAQAMTAMVPLSNLESLNLATKLGFEVQAFIKYAAQDGGPLVVLQQYKDTCRWIGNGRTLQITEGT